MKVDNNLFYSNNLDIYGDEDLPFVPLVPQAVGTGIMWPGHNEGEFSNNKVFDNWQYGTFLICIPDAIAGEAEGNVDRRKPLSGVVVPGLPSVASTSCDNRVPSTT